MLSPATTESKIIWNLLKKLKKFKGGNKQKKKKFFFFFPSGIDGGQDLQGRDLRLFASPSLLIPAPSSALYTQMALTFPCRGMFPGC